MAENKVSKAGVYFDLKAGKVVDGQVEEGYQLVPPGGEITGERQAVIDQFKAVEDGNVVRTAVEPEVEQAADDQAPAKARKRA